MTKRILLGEFPDGGYGLRASLPGYDVTSNPVDNTQLAFSSDWQAILPIYLSGASLGLSNGSDTSISFTALSSIPLGFFLSRPNGQTGWNSMPVPYNGTTPYLLTAVYIDHLRIINHSGLTVDVAYAIFARNYS
jgi:hypothetical protein